MCPVIGSNFIDDDSTKPNKKRKRVVVGDVCLSEKWIEVHSTHQLIHFSGLCVGVGCILRLEHRMEGRMEKMVKLGFEPKAFRM